MRRSLNASALRLGAVLLLSLAPAAAAQTQQQQVAEQSAAADRQEQSAQQAQQQVAERPADDDRQEQAAQQRAQQEDAADDDAWTDWEEESSGVVVDKLKMGTEYTFELRALGASRAGVGDLHGPSASTDAMMAVPSPSLPEIAMLLLAMLLLGSGAYLLRRRQLGGLTPA